jgi:GlcNAc-P-P-Und epimerase
VTRGFRRPCASGRSLIRRCYLQLPDSNLRFLVTGGSGFIGTNLIQSLLDDGHVVLNLDKVAPLCPSQASVWAHCNLMDARAVERNFSAMNPTHVIHMAARTDCEGKETSDYLINTEGTRHVLTAVSCTPTVRRLLVTSTQFVCEPGFTPKHDLDFRPHTAYGASKVAMEQMVHAFDLPCAWTIVRPTTIWGPWLTRHVRQVFRALRWGIYLHPGHQPVIRSWGYVENSVFQMRKLITLPSSQTHGGVFYVGDEPINLLDWVNAFSRQMRQREVHVVPRVFVRTLALMGDLMSAIGLESPLTSARYRSMTQDYLCPMEKTFSLLGPSPFNLENGVERTLRWLRRPLADAISSSRGHLVAGDASLPSMLAEEPQWSATRIS